MTEIKTRIRPNGRQSLTREVVDAIAKTIVNGIWKPGDVIPTEKELAERFEVGRSTIREAVQSLVIMGVLEIRRGEGTYVREPTASLLAGAFLWGLFLGPRTVRDFTAFRICVEVECAGQAARHRTQEQVDSLYNSLEQIKIHQGNKSLVMEHDNQLHVTIAEAAGNPVFTKVVETLQSVVGLWFPVTSPSDDTSMRGTPEKTHNEHLAVIDAIRDQDEELARGMMRRHLSNAGQRLAQLFDDR